MRWRNWLNFYIFYTLTSVLKLYLVRIILYKDYNFFRAIGLELAPLLVLFGLAEIAGRKFKHAIYLVVSFLFSTIILAIILYYQQFGRIINYQSIYLISYIGHVQASLKELFSYWYLVFYVDLLAVFLLLGRKRYSTGRPRRPRTIRFAVLLLCALLVSGFNIYEQRADRINITQFARTAGIMNAEGVQVYRELKQNWSAGREGSIRQADIEAIRQYGLQTGAAQDSQTSAQSSGEPLRQSGISVQPRNNSAQPRLFASAQGKNLIVVQLESFQDFLIGLSIEGQEVTPNLNRLAKESLEFRHFFSQIGQGNTSDAEFVFNTSLYALADGAISSSYKNKAFPSLPKLLRQAGYESFTFHVNDLSFWNRKELYAGLGFDHAYDRQFFGEDDILGMGPSDQVLFRKGLPILVEAQRREQKFYAQFITLTSHHPYILPPDRLDLRVPQELEGTLTGNYLKSVHYVDEAIGEFIESLKRTGLWDKSVVVFYGDHFGLNPNAGNLGPKESAALAKLLGHDYNEIDTWNVPLLIRVPGLPGQTIFQSGGQADALPTLTNLLGLNLGDQIHFGVDLLNTKQNLIPLRYYYPDGTFIDNQVFFRADTKTTRQFETQSLQLPSRDLHEEQAVLNLTRLADLYLHSLPERDKTP